MKLKLCRRGAYKILVIVTSTRTHNARRRAMSKSIRLKVWIDNSIFAYFYLNLNWMSRGSAVCAQRDSETRLIECSFQNTHTHLNVHTTSTIILAHVPTERNKTLCSHCSSFQSSLSLSLSVLHKRIYIFLSQFRLTLYFFQLFSCHSVSFLFRIYAISHWTHIAGSFSRSTAVNCIS